MKRRPKKFSVTKAVKRNARDRVGTPPPEKVLPDAKSRAERRSGRHKQTLSQMLHHSVQD